MRTPSTNGVITYLLMVSWGLGAFMASPTLASVVVMTVNGGILALVRYLAGRE